MSKKPTKNKKRWTEGEARRVLAKQRSSGQSIARFAQDEGLVAGRLYRWQKRLQGAQTDARAAKIEFAEVAHIATGARERRFEVELAGGRRVWVPEGFVAEDMARLVAVLEGQRC